MVIVREGEKKDIAVKVERTRGSGEIAVTVPQYRILNASRALVAGFDWAVAVWDDVNDELYMLFDSTVVNLSTPGTYYVQLRGTINTERYQKEVTVHVVEVGP